MPTSNIKYASGDSLIGKIFWQLPKVLWTTIVEHIYLKKLIKTEKIACVISDHRLGLFNKNLISILVIHQLNMRFPSGLKRIGKVFNRLHYHVIRKFDQVWIPDLSREKNIAGDLSTPPLKISHFYKIGILSKFLLRKESIDKKTREFYDMVVLLSGPEPQRSILENILTGQLSKLNRKVFFIRGISGENTLVKQNNLHFVSHLNYREMLPIISGADIVICRSGYSSIMDLIALGKQGILIPTPGQTEQEYLSDYLKEKGYFYSEKQKSFDISRALKSFHGFYPPQIGDFSPELYTRLKWLNEQLKKYKGKHKNG